MFHTTTEFKPCNDIPKENCDHCRAERSVSKIEARTRKNLLIAKIRMSSEYLWRCDACGWTTSPTVSTKLTKSQPTSISTSAVFGTTSTSNPTSSKSNASRTPRKKESPPAPVTEMNYMYRTAEQWHRPPSFVNELPLKMPALRAESPNVEEHTPREDA